jgi:hypothetical protein
MATSTKETDMGPLLVFVFIVGTSVGMGALLGYEAGKNSRERNV